MSEKIVLNDVNLDVTERLRDHGFAVEYVKAMEEEIEAMRKASKWQPIETAPHETDVILYAPATGHFPAKMEIGWASGGKRVKLSDGSTASNMWSHGYATHWMPLPPPPEDKT